MEFQNTKYEIKYGNNVALKGGLIQNLNYYKHNWFFKRYIHIHKLILFFIRFLFKKKVNNISRTSKNIKQYTKSFLILH